MLLLTTHLGGTGVQAKKSVCKKILQNDINDFFYCTKFSVGRTKAFKSYYTAKFTRSLKEQQAMFALPELKDRDNVIVSIAIYHYKQWGEMLQLKNATCKQKEELAFRLTRARVPLDGTKTTGWVTTTERNWHLPSMYFMAVMDCDDEI